VPDVVALLRGGDNQRDDREPAGRRVVEAPAVGEHHVGTQAARQGAPPGSPYHQVRAAQGGSLAVQHLRLEAGHQVQPGSRHPAQQVARLAALRHQGPGQFRQPDRGQRVRFAFGLIAVQHPVGPAAIEHARELPGQVHRVSHPGPHALADERRGQVRGITEQEDPPVAPAVGELGAEGVLGDPDDLQFGGGDVRRPRGDKRMQPGQAGVVGRGFPWRQPEFPPVAALPDPHERAGPARVADLMHAFPLADIGIGGHVDDEPALREVQVLHGGADAGPDQAAGSVAAQHVLREDSAGLAGGRVGDVDSYATLVLGQGYYLAAPAQGDGVVPGEAGAQDSLELRLVEHVRLRVAVLAVGGVPRELGQHAHVAVQQSQSLAGPGDRGELLAEPEAAQDAVDLVVEVDRPGPRVGRFAPVEHQALDAVLRQQRRRGQPGRTRAHDDDGNRPGVHGAAPG
jgi:hypothetical protein